jgi:hypothetical protein
MQVTREWLWLSVLFAAAFGVYGVSCTSMPLSLQQPLLLPLFSTTKACFYLSHGMLTGNPVLEWL